MTRSRRPLRIAVAAAEPAGCKFYRDLLLAAGHQVSVARSGPQLVRHCRLLLPDLVLVDLGRPGRGGAAAAARVYRERPVPVLLVVSSDDPEALRAAEGPVAAYLVKPVNPPAVTVAIAVTLARFRRLPALRKKTRLGGPKPEAGNPKQ